MLEKCSVRPDYRNCNVSHQKNVNFGLVLRNPQELFVQFLAKQGHNIVLAERKPRKIIQYKDMGADTALLFVIQDQSC